MNNFKSPLAVFAALFAIAAVPAHADVIVSEVAPWSSGSSPVAADWFEVTNTGAAAIDISGWKVDDNSNSFASAVALSGITTIAAGESVIFVEGAVVNATFLSNWFGANPPAGLQVGNYTGSGIGLSTGGDAVNLFNVAGVLQASVSFGASPTGPFATFDNAAGLTGPITLLSAVGVNGAFAAANSASEIGSPGRVSAVPEPGAFALMLAGLASVGALVRRRQG